MTCLAMAVGPERRRSTGRDDVRRLLFSLIMVVVLLMGGGALSGGVRLLLAGNPNVAGAVAASLMGVLLTGLGAGYFYWCFVRRPIEAARLERVRRLYPGQPWMERSDWASRRLTSSSLGTSLLTWAWTVVWFGALATIATVNRDKILASPDPPWWKLLILSIFVGFGLLALTLAISFTRHATRFGTSVLMLDTLPAFMGDRFIGRLTARLEPTAREPIDVELVCEEVEWVQTGHGKNRKWTCHTHPLGSTRTTVDPARFMRGKAGATGRVAIDVPTGLPASHLDEQGNGTRWWLRLSTRDPKMPFSAAFEVPVFERRGAESRNDVMG